MRIFRLLLSITVASWVTGLGQFTLAQETNTSPFSITLSPVQYADVKGNVDKFRALNWMKDGGNAGISDMTFVKDINKDISLSAGGSVFAKTDDYTGHLTLKDGDLAFLKIDYNAFRKYYDNTGGVYYDAVSGTPWPPSESGIKASSPDLQMDISYFKLEAGVGPISDPFLDVAYEHNSKDGYKSLLSWGAAYNTGNAAYRYIGPSWMAVNDTVDTITLKEKKEIAGVTIKGEQKAEIDYNHNKTYIPYNYVTAPVPVTGKIGQRTEEEYLDAKLFGSGVRVEKWMLNDNTFAALGYHYNHVRDTDLMQNVETDYAGVVYNTSGFSHQSLWSNSLASEDEHVWVGNFNSNLTPNLAFSTDARYEHMGSEGSSVYNDDHAVVGTAVPSYQSMDNHQDREGEHVALRYSGLPHTSLYAESDFEQQRNWFDENILGSFQIARIARTEKQSWTLGGKVVPNRFFTFTTQLKQSRDATKYDTVLDTNPGNQTFLDFLAINGNEASETITWKPHRRIQNSFRYQFLDTLYIPQASAESSTYQGYPISKNHMLSSVFTYDITVEPVDPLMLMLSYSHVENYVRTVAASSAGGYYIPTFNSGDNSWLFSSTYTPIENLTWTNTVCYTLSDNYVDFSTGVPYGTNFKELNITTGLEWTYHKWLKIGPKYEHASYRDNSLAGAGNYSANIFMLDAKFNW